MNKLAPLLVGVGLLAAACGPAEVRVSSPPVEDDAFVRAVADGEMDSGAGLSITTDAEGNPHLAYLRFEKPPEEGEVPPPADPLAPVVPAVMHAHLVGGVWTRTPVAEEAGVGPEDQTAIALDADGVHHVVWTRGGDVLYASTAGGAFGEPEEVFAGDATGIAIAAGAQGPWVSFYEVLDDPEGPAALVRVASRDDDGAWSVETAAEADPDPPTTTGIGLDGDAPLVGYGSAGETLLARFGQRWESEVADEEGGLGVSLDLDADGNPHLAYYTPAGSVRHAHSIDGSPWEVSEVGDVGSAPLPEWSTSIALADDGVHSIAFDAADGPGFATNAGGAFTGGDPVEPLAGDLRPRVAAGAEGVVYVAAYHAAGPALAVASLGAEEPLLAAPPATGLPPTMPPADGGEPACEPGGPELAVAAPVGAAGTGFDTDCLAAPAGEAFSIAFDNQDAGVPHNVAIYEGEAAAQEFLKGEIITGPATATYQAEGIAEPGAYFYRCDVHPTTMTGTFVVA